MSSKEAVENLYVFRNHYYENHDAKMPDKKIDDLTAELNKTLSLLDEQKDDSDSAKKAEYDLLKAKALNVLPDFNSEALDILTKIVKFHPKNVEAWNQLGECFWKKGDMKAAKSCFESALRERKNAESLCNLSMILRQIGQTTEEKQKLTLESLEKAKEAVDLNIQDGKPWYVLGNAYLSLFFSTNQSANLLNQCLSSYSKASSDPKVKCNPDLYFNWAVALKYDENYKLALENFEKALKYDPVWADPKEELDSLMKHLENTQLMITKKGKLRPKRIKDLLNSFRKEVGTSTEETFNDSKGKSVKLKISKFSELQEGNNDEKILKGKVACHVYCADAPSFTFCMIDGDEDCFAVNVYNMAQGKGVIIGDSVSIIKPTLRRVNFTFRDKTFLFSSIHVTSPLQLIVNNKKFGSEMLATPRVSVTLKSD